jgi:hypothetical protein
MKGVGATVALYFRSEFFLRADYSQILLLAL